jgi:hypothetical protein
MALSQCGAAASWRLQIQEKIRSASPGTSWLCTQDTLTAGGARRGASERRYQAATGDVQRLKLLVEPHPATSRNNKYLYGMQEVRGSNPLSSTPEVFTFQWGPCSRFGLSFWCGRWGGRGFCRSGCFGWLAGGFACVRGGFRACCRCRVLVVLVARAGCSVRPGARAARRWRVR